MCMSSDIPAEYYIPLWYGWDGTQGYVPVRASSDCTYKTCHNGVLFVCIANYYNTKRHYDVILWGDF